MKWKIHFPVLILCPCVNCSCISCYMPNMHWKNNFGYFYIKFFSFLSLKKIINKKINKFLMTHPALRVISNFSSNENAFSIFSKQFRYKRTSKRLDQSWNTLCRRVERDRITQARHKPERKLMYQYQLRMTNYEKNLSVPSCCLCRSGVAT